MKDNNQGMRPTYINDYKAADSFSHGGRLVCGTSGIGGVWGEVKEEESVNVLLYALERNVRAFDTAPSYANAEIYLGKALKQWKGEQPFISTKVGRLRGENAFDCKTDFSKDSIIKSLHNSLNSIGVSKVDLLYLHEPHLVPINKIDQILNVLHELKTEGLCDMIGVGGNPTETFRPFVRKENFDVVSGFLKMDACNLSAFEKDIPHLKQEGILYCAASVLHFGLLGNRFEKYLSKDINEDWLSPEDIENAQKINILAKENGMSLSSLAQRYLFSMTEADRVVVGAKNMKQVESTLNDWDSGKLSEKLFNAITDCNLDSNRRS